MEYVGGGDLASKLGAEERITIPETLKMLSQMAAGCQAIHDAGIVHRDLKPENILLTSEGNVKIADFGIARNRHGPKLTEHGGVVGTIDYVAPEYMLKSQVDWRSDIYALGILAYEMVTGESPFKGESLYATMTKRLKTDPDPPSALRSECPAELDRIILKAMQREPDSRYQAAIEMFADLQALAKHMGVAPATDPSRLTISGQSSPLGQKTGGGMDALQDLPPASALPPRRPSSGHLAREHEQGMRENPLSGSGASAVTPWSAAGVTEPTQEPEIADLFLERDVPPRQRSGTDVIDPEFVSYQVDASSDAEPYTAPEPLVSTYPERKPRERTASARRGSLFRPSKGKRSATSSGYSMKRDSYFGEIVALFVATAVGIVCGFMFLKLFAPSLLAKWHF
jgi:serine/threonine protein kinase